METEVLVPDGGTVRVFGYDVDKEEMEVKRLIKEANPKAEIVAERPSPRPSIVSTADSSNGDG